MSRICLNDLDEATLFDDCSEKVDSIEDLGIEYISFSGGGVKGVCYAGIISSLREYGILDKVKVVSGSSAGALACLFATCGLSDDYISKFAIEMDKWKIAKLTPSLGLANCLRMFRKLGINESDNLFKFIQDVLQTAGLSKNITMKEYTQATSKRMIITVTSVETVETIYVHDKTYPDMPVAFAIMASSLLPYVYIPVPFEDKFAYNGKRLLTDGGVYSNFPYRIFDYYDKNEHLVGVNRKTLIILLMNSGQYMDAFTEIESINSFSSTIINGYHARLHKMYTLDKYFWCRSIIIECGEVESNKLNINNSQKSKLITVGKIAMNRYLEQRKELIKNNGGFPVETFIRSSRAKNCGVVLQNSDMRYTLSECENPQKSDNCIFHHSLGYI